MKHVKADNSRTLEAVHDTAGDLHALGFIDKRMMHRYDALCLEPIPAYSANEIRSLRDKCLKNQL